MQPLLTIEHLTKVFPGQVALDDVDLTINAGRTHALVGQNGSGKSTLIKILAGYHQPTGEPTATYFGSDGDGAPLQMGDGKAAESHGIRFVHRLDERLDRGLTVLEVGLHLELLLRPFLRHVGFGLRGLLSGSLGCCDFGDIRLGGRGRLGGLVDAHDVDGWRQKRR